MAAAAPLRSALSAGLGRGGARGAGGDARGGTAEFRAAGRPGAAARRVDKSAERCAIGGRSGSAGCGAGVGRERHIGGGRAAVGAFFFWKAALRNDVVAFFFYNRTVRN